jgi:HAE1 family hydrophobic/amphiphilic exporter-1
MVFLALVVVGLTAYSRMSVDLLPEISFPIVVVQTAYPGAGPEEVESQVSKPIEEAVGSLNGVRSVRSTSSEGLSSVTIQFQLEHPASRAVADVQERILAIRGSLPRDVYEPVILRFDPAALPILIVAVADESGSLTLDKLHKLVKDKFKARIERLEGVAAVEVSGGLEHEIQVELSAERLKALKLSPQQVVAAIAAENLNIPAGRISEGPRDFSLRTPGNFQRVEDIAQVIVAQRGDISLRVKDIATVKDGFKEQVTYARLDGNDSVAISVRKQSGTNTVRVAKQIKDEVEHLTRDYPNLRIVVAFDSSEFIESSIRDTMRDLIVGALLAAFIVFAFFMSVRNTIITVIGLPVILIASFWAMSLFGFTINMLTLLALSLCVGLLIDDAIVVRENIFRHMEEGEEARVAASRGTAEVALAVISMTMCIVSVFLPVAFATGIIGRFLKDFGITVAAAVMISLFEAFTLAPMLSARFLRKIEAGNNRRAGGTSWGIQSAMREAYRRFLSWALSHRRLLISISIIVFFFSFTTLPFIGQTFYEELARPQFQMSLELPPGTSLDITSQKGQDIERDLKQQPQVAHVFTTIGTAGRSEQATFFIKVREEQTVWEIQQYLRQKYSSLGKLAFSSGSMEEGSASSILGRPIQVELSSTGSFEELERVSEKVLSVMSEVPGLLDIDSSVKPGKPELRVEIDRQRAADLNLSVAQVGMTLRTLISGERASRFRQGEDEADILVRLGEDDRKSLQGILSLPVLTQKGNLVPLSAVAKVSPATGPTQIERRDRQRIITIGAGFRGRPQGDVVNDIKSRLKDLNLPEEVSYRFAGETEIMYESFNTLYFSLGLSVIFVYMVLASLYGSFVQPFIIMLALPLSIIGALLALLITGKSLSLVAMIGIILLMGVVAKNSIIMVDFINMKRREGLEIREAILAAAPLRLRPILMTTSALVFGMLFIALGLGSGAEFRAPMAITVIGGLITSTFLSLVVVPVAYSFLERQKACE